MTVESDATVFCVPERYAAHDVSGEDRDEAGQWTDGGDKSSGAKIADKVAAEGLDGFKGVMPSAMQKKIFGKPLFGKKWLKVDAAKRMVTGSFKVAFGQDYNTFEFSFDKIADLVRTGASPAF